MTAGTGPLRPFSGGVELFVRLTPKSSADALEGVAAAGDGRRHIRARVRAVPEKGAANTALKRLVAAAFGVPASSVSVTGGRTARLKTVRVSGDSAVLMRVFEAVAGGW
jgi:uncharacterized protein YggU (UPF0235/DUF167 family)